MSVDLSLGAVPPIYKEVYNIVNPLDRQYIDRELYMKFLSTINLPKSTLEQVCEFSDAKRGPVTQITLYKSLALIAVVQQGKALNEKSLQNLATLSQPLLGDLSEVRRIAGGMTRADKGDCREDPRLLGLSYTELSARDTIRVAIAPEKKGLILKHVVYEVTSQRFSSTVHRRYNDFIALHEVLLQRFPYRAVPILPPKRAIADAQFIEERRRALKRFLTLVARHPVLSEDKSLVVFLTFNGTDVQPRLKEQMRNLLDEFMTSNIVHRLDELVLPDTTVQFAVVREQLRQVLLCLTQMRDVAQRMVDRSKAAAVDILLVRKELAAMSGISKLDSDWGTGGNPTWNLLHGALGTFQSLFTPVHEAYSEQSLHEEEEVLEELSQHLDLLVAFKELCDRHESGVVLGHHKAINRMVKKSTQSSGAMGDPMKQAQQLEHRTQFSLHCVHLESQLVYAHTDVLVAILQAVVRLQTEGHAKLGRLWEKMQPTVSNLIPGTSSNR
uniref:Putative sorting nexin-8-like apis mellifera sorting nexin-8-like protein n=1 Tax=Ornithodoros turicata TaxID=34597 RepID=A0A2R5LKU5_9ACAR